MHGIALMDEKPPLVLHVIHHLVTGGMENGLINLVDGMSGLPFRHAIVCIEDYSEFRQRLRRRDVEVIALHRSREGIWRTRRRLYQLCRHLRPSIVHTRNLSGLDALLPARLAGVRCCVHGEHGWDVHDLHGDGFRPALLRRLHRPVIDHYVTVSRDLARYLGRRIGVAESRITPICNGVDLTRFSPSKPADREILPPNFRGDDVTVFGTVGRIQPVKDQRTLVCAFARLLQNDTGPGRPGLAVVGDGPLLGDLRALVATLGIADRVWLPGTMSDIPSVLRAIDVFALPSLNEGISNTILEAMASARPVIASDVGGNRELIVDGETGSLVPASDVGALAEAMRKYANDPDLARRHGSAGRARANSLYGIDTMIAGYASLYERLLADTRGKSPKTTARVVRSPTGSH
jgi:sugar transferase (PEP-CTERM/EpsH1 system associated)